jgi:hypothetical protein
MQTTHRHNDLLEADRLGQVHATPGNMRSTLPKPKSKGWSLVSKSLLSAKRCTSTPSASMCSDRYSLYSASSSTSASVRGIGWTVRLAAAV